MLYPIHIVSCTPIPMGWAIGLSNGQVRYVNTPHCQPCGPDCGLIRIEAGEIDAPLCDPCLRHQATDADIIALLCATLQTTCDQLAKLEPTNGESTDKG